MSQELHVVTGALGYSGRHMARGLLERGVRVRTLTSHGGREDPFEGKVEVAPLDFGDPRGLVDSMKGARVLYNTYWVRFDHGDRTHSRAVENTKILIRAAQEAGVERVVHVSITNPNLDSPLPYFRGKAELEEFIRSSGLSYAILRPTVLFGGERDVLLNNIAWMIRRFPVFGMPGRGEYSLQPVHVEDLAHLSVEQGWSSDSVTMDAVGPEIYTYRELVQAIATALGRRRLLLPMPRMVVLLLGKIMGALLGDVVITADEIDGLSAGLLVSKDPPTGKRSFSEYLSRRGSSLGRRWSNELRRHFRR